MHNYLQRFIATRKPDCATAVATMGAFLAALPFYHLPCTFVPHPRLPQPGKWLPPAVPHSCLQPARGHYPFRLPAAGGVQPLKAQLYVRRKRETALTHQLCHMPSVPCNPPPPRKAADASASTTDTACGRKQMHC